MKHSHVGVALAENQSVGVALLGEVKPENLPALFVYGSVPCVDVFRVILLINPSSAEAENIAS